MEQSRRNFIHAAGASLAALSTFQMTTAYAQNTRTSVATGNKQNIPTEASGKQLNIVNFDILEAEAKKVMPEASSSYIIDGAGDQWTLRENRRAFNDYTILAHHLVPVSARNINLNVKVLGLQFPSPIMVAPMGAHLFAHPQAEVIAAAGAAAAGALYQCSGASNRPLEDIAKASGNGLRWFQLYFNADVGITRSLLERAKHAGFSAIIITADALGPGMSDAFIRLGMPFPPNFSFGNHDPKFGGSGNFMNQKVGLTPDDIDFVKSVTGLPVIVKGIMRSIDADIAINAGADAIQVSNHGGRQLDGVPSTISVLKEVAAKVNGRVPILFDSGIRRGIDVVRALSLGATAVALGRPVLYGAAIGGVHGVQSVIEHLQNEVRTAMLLTGAKSVKDLSPDYLKV